MLTTQCLCTKLRRSARAVTRVYDDALKGVGLTTAQFSLLRHLSRLEQPSISDLADAMGLDRSTLGRNLRPLESEGLVRLDEGADLRNRIVVLTPAGLERIMRGREAWDAAQQDVAAHLGDDKRRQLEALLDELATLDS
ncbi:MarR family winged helix-turn-helix transcriptional regulator [Pseudomonas sp. ZM23]|uniref:MarR family winged helix-turn-helix transcriptional regulator n=1 Tax=Pseudomonas triclosanedens TaxID=2961893 RepID=A0ABY7A2Z3_9PSED|nr:MarR family winged helix-turn-helix transcriptional regulator [Pseudomonas triclosanedens]MCP8464262.1 MarR family winged helix-turn-helix transcriptional regulator [Pseudomonas triclosanedens]MCP8471396.1 MarR family winged helix-turn-helix transcriptional regulator [Pseudomonas triclosanedens]MCP8477795.1 MarR family winged helix-turn-helix transcriptional regulator [Pseudomonas triclosanedens]WAI51247.1 MarR family winged helix-turn-helix transcriptional regulator [Pseudomonas triclosaned